MSNDERERQDAVFDMASARAARADAARAAVAQQIKALLALPAAELSHRIDFRTEEAKTARRTLTMSVSQAMALATIAGPVSRLRADGAAGLLFAAMEIARRQLLIRGDGTGPSRRAALMVLKVAVDDCIARLDERPSFLLPRRSWSRRKRPEMGDLLKPG